VKHNEVIRQEFSKQASSFGNAGLTLSSQEILKWVIESLLLDKNMRVLDVAAGTGHLSRAIAPHVKEVVAIDITPEMLEEARKEAASEGLNNIQVNEGNAEKLPYENGSFDLVVSRLAIHHFENPILPLREMHRVCKPNHTIGVVDLLSPEEDEIAQVYNRLEKLRDPSHAVALARSQMLKIFDNAGFTVDSIETRDVVVDFQRWVQMTKVAEETVTTIHTELLNDINDGTKTGMRPFIDNGVLKFMQVWSIISGRKN